MSAARHDHLAHLMAKAKDAACSAFGAAIIEAERQGAWLERDRILAILRKQLETCDPTARLSILGTIREIDQ